MPSADHAEQARMVLLLTLRDPSLDIVCKPDNLVKEFRDVQNRIKATSDQHAAVAEELDSLAASDVEDFSPDHVWTLIRAIKVQSHLLQMYLEPTESPVSAPNPRTR